MAVSYPNETANFLMQKNNSDTMDMQHAYRNAHLHKGSGVNSHKRSTGWERPCPRKQTPPTLPRCPLRAQPLPPDGSPRRSGRCVCFVLCTHGILQKALSCALLVLFTMTLASFTDPV